MFTFRNCKIDGLILRFQGDQYAEFINCYIKKIKIIPQRDNASGKPEVKQCVIEKMLTFEKYDRDTAEGGYGWKEYSYGEVMDELE